MFITFEGPDGSGKTTQSKLLADFLKNRGGNILYTKEPGGTELGLKLRKLLLEEKKLRLDNLAELFLFCADRTQHVSEVIKPALAEGKIVICDRYIDSTTAYQCGGRGFDEAFINTLNNFSTGNLLPDITILIDLPAEEGLKRVESRGFDKFEEEALAFHNKVRDKYLSIARNEPQRVKVFDGSLSKKEIFQQIKDLFSQ